VFLPVLPNGVEYQHFNSDPETPAVFIAAEENAFDALGVDMGSGFEQLEDSPDYEPKKGQRISINHRDGKIRWRYLPPSYAAPLAIRRPSATPASRASEASGSRREGSP
jgi:hypothetical protein